MKILRLNDLKPFLKFDNDAILAFDGATQFSVVLLVFIQKCLNVLGSKVSLNFICDFMLESVELLLKLLNFAFVHVNNAVGFFEFALIFRR